MSHPWVLLLQLPSFEEENAQLVPTWSPRIPGSLQWVAVLL
jgi:hypothetical protein